MLDSRLLNSACMVGGEKLAKNLSNLAMQVSLIKQCTSSLPGAIYLNWLRYYVPNPCQVLS